MTFENLLAMQVDKVALNERVSKFTKRSMKKESKVAALELAVRTMDLTTLEGADTPGRVQRLCQKAMRPSVEYPQIPPVAAVCVYPALVATAKKALGDSDVKVASVSTAFPAGQIDLGLRLQDVKEAIMSGADEIDMVISRNAWLRGDEEEVITEIKLFKEACGDKHLKVILEVGELGTYDVVRRASLLAMQAGADFVKTSTGKISSAASMPVTLVMLEAVRDYYDFTSKRIGVKPAGGISSAKEAVQYLVMVLETMGVDWLKPELFRFGASSLLNDVLRQLVKQKTGVYEGSEYFSMP